MRGFMNNFEAGPVVTNMKDHFRLYPLGDQPKEINFVNVAMEAFSTLHAQDFTFFEEVNEVVQEEPNSAHSDEVLGMPAAIGIEKGKVFAPDDRMKKILSDAARVGTAAQRNSSGFRVPEGRRKTDQRAGSFPLLRHGHYPGHGQAAGGCRLAVHDGRARLRRAPARRQAGGRFQAFRCRSV